MYRCTFLIIALQILIHQCVSAFKPFPIKNTVMDNCTGEDVKNYVTRLAHAQGANETGSHCVIDTSSTALTLEFQCKCPQDDVTKGNVNVLVDGTRHTYIRCLNDSVRHVYYMVETKRTGVRCFNTSEEVASTCRRNNGMLTNIEERPGVLQSPVDIMINHRGDMGHLEIGDAALSNRYFGEIVQCSELSSAFVVGSITLGCNLEHGTTASTLLDVYDETAGCQRPRCSPYYFVMNKFDKDILYNYVLPSASELDSLLSEIDLKCLVQYREDGHISTAKYHCSVFDVDEPNAVMWERVMGRNHYCHELQPRCDYEQVRNGSATAALYAAHVYNASAVLNVKNSKSLYHGDIAYLTCLPGHTTHHLHRDFTNKLPLNMVNVECEFIHARTHETAWALNVKCMPDGTLTTAEATTTTVAMSTLVTSSTMTEFDDVNRETTAVRNETRSPTRSWYGRTETTDVTTPVGNVVSTIAESTTTATTEEARETVDWHSHGGLIACCCIIILLLLIVIAILVVFWLESRREWKRELPGQENVKGADVEKSELAVVGVAHGNTDGTAQSMLSKEPPSKLVTRKVKKKPTPKADHSRVKMSREVSSMRDISVDSQAHTCELYQSAETAVNPTSTSEATQCDSQIETQADTHAVM